MLKFWRKRTTWSIRRQKRVLNNECSRKVRNQVTMVYVLRLAYSYRNAIFWRRVNCFSHSAAPTVFPTLKTSGQAGPSQAYLLLPNNVAFIALNPHLTTRKMHSKKNRSSNEKPPFLLIGHQIENTFSEFAHRFHRMQMLPVKVVHGTGNTTIVLVDPSTTLLPTKLTIIHSYLRSYWLGTVTPHSRTRWNYSP